MYLLFDTLISSSSSSLEVEQDEKKQLATPPTPAIRAAATGRIGTLRNAMSQSESGTSSNRNPHRARQIYTNHIFFMMVVAIDVVFLYHNQHPICQ
jgi:hypothetical protein